MVENVRMSICSSVSYIKGETPIFLVPNYDFLCTFLSHMSIYSMNILSIGQATKGINVYKI